MTSKTEENIAFCTPDVKQACTCAHVCMDTHTHVHNHHYFLLSSHPSACALKLETNSSVLSGIQLTIKQVLQPGPLAKHVGVTWLKLNFPLIFLFCFYWIFCQGILLPLHWISHTVFCLLMETAWDAQGELFPEMQQMAVWLTSYWASHFWDFLHIPLWHTDQSFSFLPSQLWSESVLLSCLCHLTLYINILLNFKYPCLSFHMPLDFILILNGISVHYKHTCKTLVSS